MLSDTWKIKAPAAFKGYSMDPTAWLTLAGAHERKNVKKCECQAFYAGNVAEGVSDCTGLADNKDHAVSWMRAKSNKVFAGRYVSTACMSKLMFGAPLILLKDIMIGQELGRNRNKGALL